MAFKAKALVLKLTKAYSLLSPPRILTSTTSPTDSHSFLRSSEDASLEIPPIYTSDP
uniref:Uncharacterized protein n=1 Tax=Arundo donax TaxID=35708 RepID=A0A0A9ADZ4_ARUDO